MTGVQTCALPISTLPLFPSHDRRAKNGRAMYSTANGAGRYFVRAKGIKARPFVGPAFDANKGKVAANVVNEVMGEIERSLSNG